MKVVNPAIYELLKGLADGAVTAARAKNNQAPPFIVYQKTDGQRWPTLQGPSGMAQVFMQIDCYAASELGAAQLAAQAESILDGYRGIVYHGGNSPQDFVRIGGITHQNEFETLDQTAEPFLYRSTAVYLVTFEQ